LNLTFDTTEKELPGSSTAQHQLDPDSKRHMTCGSGEITFGELTPLKNPFCIHGITTAIQEENVAETRPDCGAPRKNEK